MTYELHEFELDKKQLYERIIHEFADLKKWLTARKFHDWLKQYGEQRLLLGNRFIKTGFFVF